MTPRLRHIAVHAEEPRHGQFVWVLSERAARTTWKEIQRADEPDATYQAAMAAGLLALQALADDLDAGPRTTEAAPGPAEDAEDTAPEDDDEADGSDAPRKGPPPKKSVFGFGPAR